MKTLIDAAYGTICALGVALVAVVVLFLGRLWVRSCAEHRRARRAARHASDSVAPRLPIGGFR